MKLLQEIYEAIAMEGFSAKTLSLISKYINEILYGTASISRFNLPEHAGLCSAGSVLIGASIVSDYARESLETSCHATGSQGSSPTNWQIDELQETHFHWYCKVCLNHRPSTFDSWPQTLDSRPLTLDPWHSTLDPRPLTLDSWQTKILLPKR